MTRLVLFAAACAFFSAAAAPCAPAQSAAPAVPGQSAAPSAAPQAQDPAAATPAPADQKKVWTNEDMGALREDPSISSYNSRNKQGGQRPAPRQGNPGGHTANWYRAQIEKLQAQIPPIDAKIAELQKGINGGSVNDPNTSSRPIPVHAGSWQQQVDDLQAKKQNILGRIAGLEDQARHDGIPPNDIP